MDLDLEQLSWCQEEDGAASVMEVEEVEEVVEDGPVTAFPNLG